MATKKKTRSRSSGFAAAGSWEVVGLVGLTLLLLSSLALFSYQPLPGAEGASNWIGTLGHLLASALVSTFGILAPPLLLFALAAISHGLLGGILRLSGTRTVALGLATLSVSALLHLMWSPLAFRGAEDLAAGGIIGLVVAEGLATWIAVPGAWVVCASTLVVAVRLATGVPVREWAELALDTRVGASGRELRTGMSEALEDFFLRAKEKFEDLRLPLESIEAEPEQALVEAETEEEADAPHMDAEVTASDPVPVPASAGPVIVPPEFGPPEVLTVAVEVEADEAGATPPDEHWPPEDAMDAAMPPAPFEGLEVPTFVRLRKAQEEPEPVQSALPQKPRPAPERKSLMAKEVETEGSSGPRIIPSEYLTRPSLQAEAVRRVKTVSREYAFPPLDLLSDPPPQIRSFDAEELRQKAALLEAKLRDYGVKGTVREIHPGPVVTMYEFVPAPGIKVSKIASLSDDLSMALRSVRVRIVAPLPGRGAVGIEVPNELRQMVVLSELLTDSGFDDSKRQLPIAVGKDISGKPIFTDWARMPHLLVAGTTGSGKSVAVNAIILSLLFCKTPNQLRLILVDPKMLEFNMYDGIPHLLVPVVTDPRKASTALRWAVQEMEARYALLASRNCRNIVNYNRRMEELRGAMKRNGRDITNLQQGGGIASQLTDETLRDDDGRPVEDLAYICIVIDEFADLMMVAAKEVQDSVVRLAQKARAAGVHLLLATQRPSVDVITGLIKANFPSRMSFRVSSGIDSRTVLGSQGAEHLLGQGDMLMLPPGTSELKRVHGSFVSDEEVESITSFLKTQGAPQYLDSVLEEPAGAGDEDSEVEYDSLFDDAVAVVAQAGAASTSMIQRKLKIGYNRAARIIEQMERDGIVGPGDGAKPRQVLVQSFE